MKNLKLATICLCFALVAMATVEADAGRIKKPKKGSRTEMPEEWSIPRRFDNLPRMSFVTGVLSQDAHTGWKVGETPLYLGNKCSLSMAGEETASLQAGSKAVVMGVKMGESISAWAVQMKNDHGGDQAYRQSGELKEPGADPNVGVLLNQPD